MSVDVVESVKRARTVLMIAILTLLNLIALFIELHAVLMRYDDNVSTDYLLSQEIWGPFAWILLAQGAVNGVLLLASRRTRRAGLGVLVGTLAAALAYCVFGIWLIISIG
jgi:hypothetical protein